MAIKINKIQRIQSQRVGLYYLLLASKEKYVKDRRKLRLTKLLKIILLASLKSSLEHLSRFSGFSTMASLWLIVKK